MKNKYATKYAIDSKRHHIETMEHYKIATDPFDDRCIRDSYGSFSFFHLNCFADSK